MKVQFLVRCLVVLAVVLLPVTATAGEIARVHVGGSQVDWEPLVEHESLVLTVSRPDESTVRQELAAGKSPVFVLAAGDPDGVYTWELRANPRLSEEVKRELQAARKSGDPTAMWRLRKEGKLPGDLVQSGSFTVERGAIVPPDQGEEKSPAANKPAKKAQVRQNNDGLGVIFEADQVIPDDLIVQGSTCVGFDCVNNESFGFDTIRLKENNTRIKFEDTSTGSFPTNDWQLTANDSASGGSSKFSIEDITGAKVPFTITAGASTNSIFVDSTGRVGFRTSTPVLDLHIATSNTPSLRLEQNNSGGFTAQTWDIAGNEANFFVRDVTGGSRLPFRIRPGAPTSSLDISADGDVGVGTASPSAKLHVASTGAGTTDGKLLVKNTSGTAAGREMLELNNNGSAVFILNDASSANSRWGMASSATSLFFDNAADAAVEMTLDTNGNLTISGVYSPSDVNLKKNIVPVRGYEILTKLAAVPISTWSFKTDDIRHIGPMSQDFAAAFGLGINDKTISPNDMAGISLAAVQGLNEVVQEKDKEIADLKSRIEALEKMVQSLAQDMAAAEP